MKGMKVLLVATVVMILAAPGLSAAADSDRQQKFNGEVVALRQSVATENQGAFTEIKVRTREQREVWLRLGPSDEMGNGFQVGDTVRARARNEGQNDPLPVRDIQNYTTGEKMKIRDRDGTLRQDRDRARDGDGNGDRTRAQDQKRDRDGDGDQARDRDRDGDQTRDRDQMRDGSGAGDRTRDRDQVRDGSGAGDRHHGQHHDRSNGSGNRGNRGGK